MGKLNVKSMCIKPGKKVIRGHWQPLRHVCLLMDGKMDLVRHGVETLYSLWSDIV